jgi:hypothetical protein
VRRLTRRGRACVISSLGARRGFRALAVAEFGLTSMIARSPVKSAVSGGSESSYGSDFTSNTA